MRKYDDLIALLREADADECNEAASAIEALLAEKSALRERLSQLREDAERQAICIELLRSARGSAAKERDAALVDARRYRKLCELAEFGEWCIGKNTILDSWGLTSTEYMDDKADADKQLDAAMKESGND